MVSHLFYYQLALRHCQVVDHPPQPMTSYPQPYPLADRANLRRDSRHDATR